MPSKSAAVSAHLAPPPALRFALLILTTSVAFSGFFSYDLPGITSGELSALWHGASVGGKVSGAAVAVAAAATAADDAHAGSRLGAAFALYALPNAVVPLLAGVAYARLGVWRSLIAISVIIALGVGVIALGVAAQSLRLFLLGRFLYGLVGESMLIGLDVLVSDWFRHAELGLAMGVVQGAAQTGSVAAFYGVPPLIAAAGGAVLAPYVLAFGLCVVAVLLLLSAQALERVAIRAAAAAMGASSGEAVAKGVLKALQGSSLDGHKLVLQLSQKKAAADAGAGKRKGTLLQPQQPDSCKVVVRNVAFEATRSDILGLFTPFGHVKSCRLPRKFDGTHR